MPPNSPSSTDGAGLPDDLLRVLRDHKITVPQDQAVFELMAKYAKAPTETASAMTADEWREAWVVMYGAFQGERERTRVLEEALRAIKSMADAHVAGASVSVIEISNLARSSLAAVAVEDDGNDEGYERPPAATVTASQGADVDLRPFPMLDGPPIPWYVARSVYVHLYGPGEQTLDRIGERGGFGWGEVALMWKDKAARRVSDRDRERCAAEIEAAGTLAAEPPHDPKERT